MCILPTCIHVHFTPVVAHGIRRGCQHHGPGADGCEASFVCWELNQDLKINQVLTTNKPSPNTLITTS